MENITCIKSVSDKSFRYIHKQEEAPDLSNYMVHTHDFYELLIFLEGDASFVAEGATHPLSPLDAIVTRPGEMHQIFHHTRSRYERILLNFTDSFFANNDCSEYRRIFTDREMGRENIIRSGSMRGSAVLDAVQRIERYIREGEQVRKSRGEHRHRNDVVIRCAVIELLHALNQLKPDSAAGTPQSAAVRRAADYINRNLAGDLSLEELSERFFVSKYHLCRMFKTCMGMTIGQYITRKRILLAKSLYQDGCSLSEAALQSGFADYSSFYKACVKEFGTPPKKSLAR